ncbi:tripartite motif-containing protein 2-like isoform X2 [Clavelina lepadiformis]|uniref:tripartite motif-containing protein 2-like isoform X2 n=1 Tax=Clavelina lepadiformis TaxID=159417 RepID=UPI0040427D09
MNNYDTMNIGQISQLLLTCNLCEQLYTKPKILPCFHTFCESCLGSSVPPHSLGITCSECYSHYILPEEGVAELKCSFLIYRLMETYHNMDLNQNEENESLGFMEFMDNSSQLQVGHPVDNNNDQTNGGDDDNDDGNSSDHQMMRCNQHEEERITCFCDMCETLLCEKCLELRHKHHPSSVVSLDVVAGRSKESLLTQTDKLKDRRGVLEKWLHNIEETITKLDLNRDFAEQNLSKAFKVLEEALYWRKEESLKEITERFTEKAKLLTRQKNELSCYIRNMDSACQFVAQNLSSIAKNSDSGDVTLTDDSFYQLKSNHAYNHVKDYFLHKHMTSRLDSIYAYGRAQPNKTANYEKKLECSGIPDTDSITAGLFFTEKFGLPNGNCYFEWKKSDDFERLLNVIQTCKVGTTKTHHALAEKSKVNGECLQNSASCIVGEETRLFLTTKDFSDVVESSGLVDVTASAEYCDESDHKHRDATSLNTVSRNAEENGNGMFSNQKNLIQESQRENIRTKPTTICKIKTNINGSYEIIFVPHFPGKYSLSVKIHGQPVLKAPCIVEAFSKPPAKENRNQKFKTTKTGTRNEARHKKIIRRPKSTGRIINPIETDMLSSMGKTGKTKGEFTNPQDVATHENGKVYVTDTNKQCVQVFLVNENKDMTIKFVSRFGQKGRGVGDVCRPTGITTLPSGDLAVSDYDNKVVNLFSPDGKFRSRIGSGKLQGPRGVCVNRNNHLIVIDNKQCKVFLFQLNGRLVTKFGSRGTGSSQLAGPHYAVVDQNNDIYITDFYNHCIKRKCKDYLQR